MHVLLAICLPASLTFMRTVLHVQARALPDARMTLYTYAACMWSPMRVCACVCVCVCAAILPQLRFHPLRFSFVNVAPKSPMLCAMEGCPFYGSADSACCSQHRKRYPYLSWKALMQSQSHMPELTKKYPYSEALKACDERRRQRLLLYEEAEACRRRWLLRQAEANMPPDPAECYAWVPAKMQPDEEVVGSKGRWHCILCNAGAEKSHLHSKKHETAIARYKKYLEEEGIASTAEAAYECAAHLQEADARRQDAAARLARRQRQEADERRNVLPQRILADLERMPERPKPAWCAMPKRKGVCFRSWDKALTRWTCIVSGLIYQLGPMSDMWLVSGVCSVCDVGRKL